MFNVDPIVILQSIVVEGFPTTDIWALETLVAFQKINFQGRNKWMVQSMSANEFIKVPHTIRCKISLGIMC